MSNEDKAKLDNIAQLQNICEQTKQEGHVVIKSVINENSNNNNNDNNAICNGMNIRREKTRREKIEMEIKKWNKKVENQKSGIINNSGISSSHHIVIDDINSCQNNVTMNNNNNSDMGYDVVQLDEYKKDSGNVKGNDNNNSSNNNTTILKHNLNEDYNIINSNSNNITQTFICYICQRKFPSEEKLKLHESMSELHKANLEKQKKETLS